MSYPRFSKEVLFFVPGVPQPGGSKKGFAIKNKATGKTHVNIVEDAKKNAPWRAKVALAASHLFEDGPLTGPLKVSFKFVMPRPKSHYGTGRKIDQLKADAPEYPTGKPDRTKLMRSTEDALTGIAWVDDAQIVAGPVYKAYATDRRPGCWISIQQIEPTRSTGAQPALFGKK